MNKIDFYNLDPIFLQEHFMLEPVPQDSESFRACLPREWKVANLPIYIESNFYKSETDLPDFFSVQCNDFRKFR